jgi:hypothetical protein
MDYWDYRLIALSCTIFFGVLILGMLVAFVVRDLITRGRPRLGPSIASVVLVIAIVIFVGYYPHYFGLAYPPQIRHLVEIADSVNDGYIEDVYDCDDMAVAFWEEATADGYRVQIAVGNIDRDVSTIEEANHAWCTVWVEGVPLMSKEGWLAIEVTDAFPVFPDDNQRYYRGFFYDTPSEMPPFLR